MTGYIGEHSQNYNLFNRSANFKIKVIFQIFIWLKHGRLLLINVHLHKKKTQSCKLVSIGKNNFKIGSVVEWLKRRDRDRHGLSLKPTRAILLCLWEQHFTALSPAWWFWQAVLN